MQRLAEHSDERVRWRRDALVFFLSATAGWAYEVLLYALDGKGWVNRGFLYGPYLPIYGFGAVLMLSALRRFDGQPDVVFLLGALLSGAVEWLTGEALWALYGRRWWDYTGFPYQIRGFVCLHSILAFGVGGLILIYRVAPAVDRWLGRIPPRIADRLCLAMMALPAVDFLVTLCFRYPPG
ncbi:MAG: putative ABC transporter permease [Clostridia bacterium]|nr:putative ABC transporter permease [Clostridia bacterium]